MSDKEQNFVSYDYGRPASVFSASDNSVMLAPLRGASESAKQKIKKLETAIYNKTTGDVHFELIPGLRPTADHKCIYIARFCDVSYGKLIKQILEKTRQVIDKRAVGEGYWAQSPAFRIIVSDKEIFYPIEFWGKLRDLEKVFLDVAASLSAKTGRFEDYNRFEVAAIRYDIEDIKIETFSGRSIPKKW